MKASIASRVIGNEGTSRIVKAVQNDQCKIIPVFLKWRIAKTSISIIACDRE